MPRKPQPPARRGSQKWLQRAVARAPGLLQPSGLPPLEWCSPLADDEFSEYGDAAFLFGRDSPTVTTLRKAELAVPEIAFAPDSTFGMDVRDDARAERFLANHDLIDRRFLCVIPRLRYSPYPEMYGYRPSQSERERMAENEIHQQSDHEILRQLMIAFVRQTGWKVVACPEMTYGVALAKSQLVDPLPLDVREQVVWRDSFWRCDEAASVYAKSLAVVSLDCHSPILALLGGTPSIHLRLPTDNLTKSQMFADIGLPQWILQHTTTTAEHLTSLVMNMVNRYGTAVEQVQNAMRLVRERQAETMQVIQQTL